MPRKFGEPSPNPHTNIHFPKITHQVNDRIKVDNSHLEGNLALNLMAVVGIKEVNH
jgi:hypothetical protein